MKAGPAPGSREAQQPAVAVDHLASGHDPEPTVASADHGSTSSCYGACSSAHGGWPPLLTRGAPRVAERNASLLGTTKRKDGSLQVTYAGHPLYYWSGDTAHSILCQHVQLHGGCWYVVDPSGVPNTAKGVGMMAAMSG
jgi:Secreted repeat of unknown function